MKKAMFAVLALTTACPLGTTAFAEKQKADIGKLEFKAQCAICHGMNAKGNGPYAFNLEVAPANLTLLARKNAGVFPADRIIDVIDGRAQIASHGSREMPIWGQRYTAAAAERFTGSPYDQEAAVRGRVLILVDYLRRIQQK
ncbi:MAG TPA: c-type cytochrome [Bradyrhizobium sp.]|jgi:mono/diheme cytochrome c family protein